MCRELQFNWDVPDGLMGLVPVHDEEPSSFLAHALTLRHLRAFRPLELHVSSFCFEFQVARV